MANKLIDAVKANKEVIIKRTLLAAGTFAGAVLVSVIYKSGEQYYIDEDVVEPTEAEPILDID